MGENWLSPGTGYIKSHFIIWSGESSLMPSLVKVTLDLIRRRTAFNSHSTGWARGRSDIKLPAFSRHWTFCVLVNWLALLYWQVKKQPSFFTSPLELSPRVALGTSTGQALQMKRKFPQLSGIQGTCQWSQRWFRASRSPPSSDHRFVVMNPSYKSFLRLSP